MPVINIEPLPTNEIFIPKERMLWHPYHDVDHSQDARLQVVPADPENPPRFTSPYFLVNIGSDLDPTLLELRFEPTDHGFHIALLMTNERSSHDLQVMSDLMVQKAHDRGIYFDTVAAPASLGTLLAQEIARQELNSRTSIITLQKGKPYKHENGIVSIGPPKPWIPVEAGVSVRSGTSNVGVEQMLYLDPKTAEYARDRNVLLVDDALLTRATMGKSLELFQKMGVKVSGIVTVLNESEDIEEFEGIPCGALTKLPIFDGEIGNLTPRPGSYKGLSHFYS